MTDNEILKALERCSTTYNCGDCPYYCDAEDCPDPLMNDALDLINRQKAENDSLKVDLAKCSIRLDNLYKTADEIKSEAIKEFAKRLIEKCYEVFRETDEMLSPYVTDDDIDDLVKEMTEVNEDE